MQLVEAAIPSLKILTHTLVTSQQLKYRYQYQGFVFLHFFYLFFFKFFFLWNPALLHRHCLFVFRRFGSLPKPTIWHLHPLQGVNGWLCRAERGARVWRSMKLLFFFVCVCTTQRNTFLVRVDTFSELVLVKYTMPLQFKWCSMCCSLNNCVFNHSLRGI